MRTIIIVGVVLIVGLILFYAVKSSKSSTDNTDNKTPGCPNSFAIQGVGGLITTTYTQQNGKFYSQINGGLGGYQGQLPPKEITADVFAAACKKYTTPPNASTQA